MRFDLRVARGECVAVIGPSGAGKSTLLALIAGFEMPESGRILIAGEDVTGLPPARRPVTSLFQEHNLFPHLSAAANVGLGVDPGLRLDDAARARVSAALDQVGLAGFEARLPAQLSGGERQRWRWPAAWCATGRCCCWTSCRHGSGAAPRMLDLVNALAATWLHLALRQPPARGCPPRRQPRASSKRRDPLRRADEVFTPPLPAPLAAYLGEA